MRKSTKIIFTLSILLNVVLIGVVVGGAAKQYKAHHWHKVKADLSPESRNIVARNFRAAHRDMADVRGKAQKVRKDMESIFKAEEFDEAAFDKAVKKMRALKEQMHERKIEAVKELAKSLPQEERKKMAGKLARSMELKKRGGMKKRRRDFESRDWRPPQPQSVPVPFPQSKPAEE